jgi:hypothetical protein
MTQTQHKKDADIRRALDLLIEARALIVVHGYAHEIALLDLMHDQLSESAGVSL